MKTIIRNARVVNEGNSIVADIQIANERIKKIDTSIDLVGVGSVMKINAEGLYLLPGFIDD